ncbi:MAG: DUF1501 domain-containing protein [Pirellulales bacterium]
MNHLGTYGGRHSRRQWLFRTAALAGSGVAAGWLGPIKQLLAAEQQPQRHLIVLWMSGGPSQIDTFDPKPGHTHGGPVKSISSRVPGVALSEYLPKLSERADRLAVVRSLSTREGDHARGTYLVRTGRQPGTNINHPSFPAAAVKELDSGSAALPGYVAVNPQIDLIPEAYSPGYLGPRFAPATVTGAPPTAAGTFAQLEMRDLTMARQAGRSDATGSPAASDLTRHQRRWQLWQALQHDFRQQHPQAAGPAAQQIVYEQAYRLMNSQEVNALDLSQEPTEVRERYGSGTFGQGCLLARRLIERQVPVVEVTLGEVAGWDTHTDNFRQVAQLAAQLDQGWSTLMDELAERGLLERTTIVWLGEFGRTPQINPQGGRDHFPQAWSAVLAGGGIAGGQAYGATTADGMEVADKKVTIEDLLATVCAAVGVDPHHENTTDIGRPFKISDGSPIRELLT